MSVNKKYREIAWWWLSGYLPYKEDNHYTIGDYKKSEGITQKVQESDAIKLVDLVNSFSIFYNSFIKILSNSNNNSVEAALNMKGENETFNYNKKEFNNGSVIEEKSYFKKPENKEKRREIVKELKKDGYNQQERADRMGYSQSTISRDDRANKNNKKRIN